MECCREFVNFCENICSFFSSSFLSLLKGWLRRFCANRAWVFSSLCSDILRTDLSLSLHVEHRRPKASDAPHEGLLKSNGGGLGVLGFRRFGV